MRSCERPHLEVRRNANTDAVFHFREAPEIEYSSESHANIRLAVPPDEDRINAAVQKKRSHNSAGLRMKLQELERIRSSHRSRSSGHARLIDRSEQGEDHV
jgi:hypothetical protein